jgi:hypothetical protein
LVLNVAQFLGESAAEQVPLVLGGGEDGEGVGVGGHQAIQVGDADRVRKCGGQSSKTMTERQYAAMWRV